VALSCTAGTSDDDDDDDGQGAAGTGGTTGSGTASPGGGSGTGTGTGTGGTGGGGTVPVLPTCQLACTTPADCDQSSAPYDADNYTCPAGYCEYAGCNSDTECQTLGNYACRDIGAGVPLCITPCSVPADCSMGQLPYDGDNYTCPDGYCVYSGCNSDAECQALVATYVCRDMGYGVDYCLPACTVPTDCDLGTAPNDADNYACPDGGCIYTGCNSDTECQALGNYVCR
jgi:hypothetical protein